MKEKKTLYFIIICFVVLSFFIIYSTIYRPESPVVLSEGHINYSDFDFDDSSIYSINEFFLNDASYIDTDFNLYRLNILIPEELTTIGLRLPLCHTEYELYANDKLISSYSGIVTSPSPYPQFAFINTSDNHIELKLYVKKITFAKNLAFLNPVNTNDMYIGSSTAINNYQRRMDILNLFVILACFFFGLYHIVSAIYKTNNNIHIHLFVFSISVSICLLFNSQSTIHYFIPDMTLLATNRIFLIFTFIKCYSLIGYFYNYFHKPKNRKLFLISITSLISILIAIFVIPINYIYALYFIGFIFNAGIILFLIFIMLMTPEKFKSLSYSISFIGLLSLQYGLYTELQYLYGPHSYFSHFSICQLLFIALYSFIASSDYQNSVSQVHMLSPKLNASLAELQQNPSTYISTHIKPNFLYETLHSIESYIDKDNEKVDRLIQALAKYLRQALDFSVNPEKYSLKKELENCIAFSELVKEQHHEIKFEFNIDDSIKDTLIPQQAILAILENAVSNAFIGILHPAISVSVVQNDNLIEITVKDNGIGMTKEEIDYALSVSNPEQNISLFYINNQLKNNFDSFLTITSQHKKGTVISFSIPIKEVEIYD